MHKVEVEQVSFKEKNEHLLIDINLSLESGSIYGLLGKDDRSFSRLFGLMDGYKKTDGEILIDGVTVYENRDSRDKIHYQNNQDFSFEAREIRSHLELLKSYNVHFDIDYANALLSDYGIKASRMLNSLMYHETPIIDAIVALASGKPIVLLEGIHHRMKSATRDIFYKHVDAHRNASRIIVISSSEASEIEDLLDHLIIFKDGEIIVDEPVEMIQNRGFRVTGTINNILQISNGKKIIHEEHLGEVKSVIMLGGMTEQDKAYIERNRAYYSPLKIHELYEYMVGGATHE